METNKIPSDALKTLIFEYAYARFMARHLRSNYWRGKEDALMLVFNYCWALTSVDVQESKSLKQALIDVEASKSSEL